MRIYDGSPRQDFEEVLRSIGAFLDQRGMRDILLLEAPDGFIVQGLVIEGGSGTWSESVGHQVKETLTFLDDDIARFMDEAMARRGAEAGAEPDWSKAGYYEKSLRVIGRWMDSQRPHDIFFFEQDGAFVVRLQMVGPGRSAPHPGRVHEGRHRGDDHGGAAAPAEDPRRRRQAMKALKTVATILGILLAAAVVIPLAVLAALFVWLKLTEESDEEALELEQEGV